jgi:hypothetical protein
MQIMESQGTWRKMSTIGGNIVSANSSLIPMVYNDSTLLQFLSALAGEEVFTVPDPNENHVVNILHREGDLHGAHIDTYAYAFNIVMQAPPLDVRGGELEVWFDSQSVNNRGKMPGTTFRFEPGDAYFLKTDTNLHHVRPIVGDHQRIVLNLAYANSKTKDATSYSSSQLY